MNGAHGAPVGSLWDKVSTPSSSSKRSLPTAAAQIPAALSILMAGLLQSKPQKELWNSEICPVSLVQTPQCTFHKKQQNIHIFLKSSW